MSTDTTSTANRELRVSRLLNAPIELVWEVFTKPEHIAQWWGPNGFTNTIHRMDVEPGGHWEFIMHGPDGTDFKNHNVFLEVVKHERIVFDHVSTPKFRHTMLFRAEGNQTHLEWFGVFETAEQLQQVIKVFKADEGMKQNAEKLEMYLKTMHD